MREITLYKTTRADGGVTVSPNKPEDDTPYTTGLRLLADKDKALTKDGKNLCYCVDTDTTEGWYEVDRPQEKENKYSRNIYMRATK